MQDMALTVDQVPDAVDGALRRRAQAEGKSVGQVALEAIQAGLGIRADTGHPPRDLSDVAGTWIDDPAVDAALRDQDRVDPEAWR